MTIGGVRTDILKHWQELLEETFMIPTSFSSAVLDAIQGFVVFTPDVASLTVLYPITSPEVEVHCVFL